MAETALAVRHATPADLPALLDLYQHLNPGDARPDSAAAQAILARLLAFEGSQIFLGHADGLLATSCTLVVILNLTRGGQPYALIENVVTTPLFRRRGLDRLLLDAAAAAAWDCGCYKVMLLTGRSDRGTLAFYAAAGFEQTKTGFQKRHPSTRPTP
jgi:GNAT superfamily N-acetyltransferase